jgi:hypothetical protein
VICFIAQSKPGSLFHNLSLDLFRVLEELKGKILLNERLAKLIGRVNAMHYVLTSEMISASKAK